jgi:hypothetical protein
VLSIALTTLFVLLPLFVLRRDALRERRREKVRVLVYFLCLGLGFIIVEIWLIHGGLSKLLHAFIAIEGWRGWPERGGLI